MPCLIALLSLIGPRVALFVIWLTSGLIGNAIEAWWVSVLGFFALPWTTLAWVVFYNYGVGTAAGAPGVVGFEWFLVGLAFAVDVVSYAGSGRLSRR